MSNDNDDLDIPKKIHLEHCNDGVETETSEFQEEIEELVVNHLNAPFNLHSYTQHVMNKNDQEEQEAVVVEAITQQLISQGTLRLTGEIALLKEDTISFVMNGMAGLNEYYAELDASRTWICFWMLHTLELLGAETSISECHDRVISTLSKSFDSERGGFAGGPQHHAHTAPTYASVMALLVLGTPQAYSLIDRKAILKFFLSLKQSNGSFKVQGDGEIDARAMYTVLAVASILNILTPELTKNCANWIAQTQTFEGGLGGEPGNEAHGGLAYCGIASLCILNELEAIDIPAFERWLALRQCPVEGGFQGRANKLVDSCYSFWQGATFALLRDHPASSWYGKTIMDSEKLQRYVLLACAAKGGGFRDKPGKSKDYYHTCYALSGVSIAQHRGAGEVERVVGLKDKNLLQPTHPWYNVCYEKIQRARKHFIDPIA